MYALYENKLKGNNKYEKLVLIEYNDGVSLLSVAYAT